MKKVINLGRITGKTPEFNLVGKTLQMKYDDETEWRDLVEFPDDSGNGVLVVDNFSSLPAEANKDDVAFVKNEEFVETVERVEKAKIKVEGFDITNFELNPDSIFISDAKLEEKYPALAGNSIMFGAYLGSPTGEIEVQAIYYSPSMTSQQIGVNHGIDCYQITQYNNDDTMTMWVKLRGVSVKDYLTMMMEFPGTEEHIKLLLREHFDDKTEDNPSYNWMKVVMSDEPIDDSTVDVQGMYLTLIYDAEMDSKIVAIPYGVEAGAVDENGETLLEIALDFESLDKYTPSEKDTALDYANCFLNLIFFGGLEEVKYDIYSKRGFYRFDEGWKSLEEEMNIPKVAKTYADLPQSFIENGLMAVAADEVVLPEPTQSIESMGSVMIQMNFCPSIEEEIAKLKRYFVENGAPSEVSQSDCLVMSQVSFFNTKTACESYIAFGAVSENEIEGIIFSSTETDRDGYDIATVYCYFGKPGAEIDLPVSETNSSSRVYTFSEGGCWYSYQTRDNGKSIYLKSSPTKVEFNDWFANLSDMLVASIYVGYSDGDYGDEMELSSYEFDNIVRFIDESKKIVHNKGFYKFSEDKWHYQPDIAGAVFDNAEVLKCITEEDIGNFHSHDNQYYLDQIHSSSQIHSHTNSAILAQIGYDHVHTHYNKYYLDLIDSADKVHKHSNKDVVDKLGFSDDSLTYNGKLVGSSIKTVVAQNVTSISVKAGTFVKAEARDNETYQSFVAVLELYEGDDMKEYAFSIDTTNLTFNHTLYINMQFTEGSSVNIKSPIWLRDKLLYLEPNRYYEISVLDGKAIYTSVEVGE